MYRKRHAFGNIGLFAALLECAVPGVVSETEVAPPVPDPPRKPETPPASTAAPVRGDRHADLAGLHTLLTVEADQLTSSEQVEWQGQLDRLIADETAELDSRRRAKLSSKLGFDTAPDFGLAW